MAEGKQGLDVPCLCRLMPGVSEEGTGRDVAKLHAVCLLWASQLSLSWPECSSAALFFY